jgi:tripartite-type tricarboxylate transporter receptor subunit TctC
MKLPRRRFLRFAAVAAALPALSRIAGAQAYPTRTVRFIVPFGPGSGADITARLFAERLGVRWGKAVVVENRPGGDGLVAIGAFMGANEDHTLLFIPVGTFTVHPYEHDKLPYDAERDLLPIASVTEIVLAISTSGNLNVGSLGELVALARAQPGKLNAAAANGNADFLLSGFIKNAGLEIAKVPYRDILQAPIDLGEGRIQLLASSMAIVLPHLQAGRVKVLAVTSRGRAPTAPQVPTVREAGYPALELESLVGVFGPRGMPLDVREGIAADFRAVVAADPSIAAKLAATSQIVNVRGPAAFAAGIQTQRDKLAAIAKALGIKPAQ